MTKKNQQYVSISSSKDGTIDVSWAFNVFKKVENDNKISCYIPGFDMYFSASDDEMVEKKSYAITKLFLDHFFIHNKKHSLQKLALELRKLGFKDDKDATVMSSYVKNKLIPAKFKVRSNPIRPSAFIDSEETHHHAEMEVSAA